MKAAIWTAYGPPEVLELRDIEKPKPKDDQILVKLAVSNVFPGDCEIRRFDIGFPWSVLVRLACGIFKPRANSILGQEYSGVVIETGKLVTRFKEGDYIFGAIEPFVSGSYAEYAVSYGKCLTRKPDTVSWEEAAVVTVGGLNALHFLRTAEMSEGGPRKKIVLNGAGGSIGTLAIQLAKLYGADVTAVDTTHKLQKLLEIGADKVIDYTKEDFTCNGEVYDVVIDIVGKCSFFKTLRSVKPGGLFILGNGPFSHLLLRLVSPLFSNRRVRLALAGYKLSDLEYLKQLLESGRIKPVIDKRFSLEQAVDAHRYLETNQRIGNVILQIDIPH